MEQKTKETLRDIGVGILMVGGAILVGAAEAEAQQRREARKPRELDDLIRRIELTDSDLDQIVRKMRIRAKGAYSSIERATILEMIGKEWNQLTSFAKGDILKVIFTRLYNQSHLLHRAIVRDIEPKVSSNVFETSAWPFWACDEDEYTIILHEVAGIVC